MCRHTDAGRKALSSRTPDASGVCAALGWQGALAAVLLLISSTPLALLLQPTAVLLLLQPHWAWRRRLPSTREERVKSCRSSPPPPPTPLPRSSSSPTPLPFSSSSSSSNPTASFFFLFSPTVAQPRRYSTVYTILLLMHANKRRVVFLCNVLCSLYWKMAPFCCRSANGPRYFLITQIHSGSQGRGESGIVSLQF